MTSVAYSPDEKYIAASSTDNTVRRYLARFEDVWNLARQYVPRESAPEKRFNFWGAKP